MPKTVDIGIFKIGQTQVDREEVKKWLDFLEVSDEFELPDEARVSDPALLVALAGKRCYKSFEPGLNPNVTKIREDYAEYLDNIMKSGHGAVLEHSVFTFAIENVSRVFTAEMNRHRAGWAISEGSMRFIRFDKDIPYWVPDSIRGDINDDQELTARKMATQATFDEVFRFVEEKYAGLLKIWNMDESDKNFSYKKKVTSCLRRIVPMGVATGGVWTGNIRALRHVITMRCEPVAEEEILNVFSRIAELMVQEEPLMFGDFYVDEQGYYRPAYRKV